MWKYKPYIKHFKCIKYEGKHLFLVVSGQQLVLFFFSILITFLQFNLAVLQCDK